MTEDDPLKELRAAVRWTPRRKAEMLRQIEAGKLTLAEAAEHFALSPAELEGWRQALAQDGLPALRTTRLQIYQPRRRGERGRAGAGRVKEA